jgi:hypothetical protein
MLPQVRVPAGDAAGWVLTRSPNVIQVALPPGANGLRELRVAVRASEGGERCYAPGVRISPRLLAMLIAAPGTCELMETARVPGVLLEGFGGKDESRSGGTSHRSGGMKDEGGGR